MAVRRQAKNDYSVVFFPDKAYGVRRAKDREDAWLAENPEGFTLRALDDVGLLDMKYNDPKCPNGCNFGKSAGGGLTISWYSLLSELLGKKGTSVIIDASSNVYIKLPEMFPSAAPGELKMTGGFVEKYILPSIEQYHALWPDVRIVPVCIVMTAIFKIKESGKIVRGGHAVCLFLHIDFANRRVEVDYYDPWGTKQYGAFYNAGMEVTVAISKKIIAFLTQRFWAEESASIKAILNTDIQAARGGLQNYEILGADESTQHLRRPAKLRAMQAINEDSASPTMGDCTVFVAMMITLASLFPSLSIERIETDMLTIFFRGAEGMGLKTQVSDPLFRILARGTRNLTRVFSLTLEKYAKKMRKGSGLYCCHSKTDVEGVEELVLI